MEGNIVQTKEYINRVYHALSFEVRYWILPLLHYFLLIVILKLSKQDTWKWMHATVPKPSQKH